MSQDASTHMQYKSQKPVTPALSNALPRKLSQQVQDLDDKLRHLSDTILPKHPYLLSIPSDVPYRPSSRFVNTWHMGTPFVREEEQLQYMSFLPYQDEETSLVKAEGGWSDESGNIMPEESSPPEAQKSGGDTPLSNAQRKKITLHDYKNKTKGGVENIEQSLPLEVVGTSESRDLHKQVKKINETTSRALEEVVSAPQSPKKAEAVHGKKRSHEDTLTLANRPLQVVSGSPRPEKKARISSPTPEKKVRISSSGKENVDGQAGEPVASLDKPPQKSARVLSPSIPSKKNTRSIPELLFQRQPSPIQKYIVREGEKQQGDGSHDHHRTDSVRTILAAAGLDSTLHPSVKRAPGIPAQLGGQRNRSDSQISARSVMSEASGIATSASGRPLSPAIRSSAGGASRPSTPRPNGATSSPGPRQRHTISLKYGKKNRKRVEALLKFAPRGKKASVKPVPQPAARSDQPKNLVEGRQDSSVHHKRPLADIPPEPIAKRQKLPTPSTNIVEKASTPRPAGLNSPSLQSNRQPRLAFSTPKKDLKPSAMRRVESSDGFDARTPIDGPTRHSSPVSVEKLATKVSLPTSVPTSRDDIFRAWHALHQKYFELGRTIKKEGTNLGPSPTREASKKECARSVVLLIEAYLCFMLDFTAMAYTHNGPDPGWRSILPYHNFVFRASKQFPHLHGLVTQLGAVCRQILHKLDMDRLARDPLPDEQGSSAPTPGSDGNTKTNDDHDKYKKKYLEFRNDLISNAKELQVAWLDGSRLLSLDTLKQDYPQTWTKRSKDSALRGHEKLAPAKLGGDYFLPLDVSTTAVEASRFVMAFLSEWSNKEGVEWKSRIEL